MRVACNMKLTAILVLFVKLLLGQSINNDDLWTKVYKKNISLIDEFNSTFNGKSTDFITNIPKGYTQRQWSIINLFERDYSQDYIDSGNVMAFVRDVEYLNETELSHLDSNWYANLNMIMLYNNKDSIEANVTLQPEIANSGAVKWVIVSVKFLNKKKIFPEEVNMKHFISPMNHELEFMDMHKMFEKKGSPAPYFQEEYNPDHTDIFYYLLSKNMLKLIMTKKLNFHYLQIPNWAFRVSYYHKENFNSGWLIDRLESLKNTEQKDNYKNQKLNINK